MRKAIIILISVIVFIVAVLAVNLVIFEKRGSVISMGEPIASYDSTRSALLVIDVQEGITGLYSNSDYYIIQSVHFIDSVNKAILKAQEYNLPIVYIKNQITNPLINILNNSYAKGGPGVEFDNRLFQVSDYIFTKDRSDAFSNPDLDHFLMVNEINHLYISGLDAAYCVNSTIQAALNRQYTISVISDAVISENDSLKMVMINQFRAQNIDIVELVDFLK